MMQRYRSGPKTVVELRAELGDRSIPVPFSGCLIWLGYVDADGYGHIASGDGHSARGRRRVHRVAYELTKGPIPKGLVLDHLCRVRSCVNPDHMEPVTIGENVRRGVNIGDGIRRLQLAKRHCPKGHPYSGDNLLIDSRGARTCRECRRVQWRECWRRHHIIGIAA